jgi:hypothetical protein
MTTVRQIQIRKPRPVRAPELDLRTPSGRLLRY